MHKSQSLFNLTIAVHVSGITVTHLQEHKTTASTASGNHYTVLLCAAIVEKLELNISCNFSMIAADNSTVQWLPDAVDAVVLCS
jgi:hypothetical protein